MNSSPLYLQTLGSFVDFVAWAQPRFAAHVGEAVLVIRRHPYPETDRVERRSYVLGLIASAEFTCDQSSTTLALPVMNALHVDGDDGFRRVSEVCPLVLEAETLVRARTLLWDIDPKEEKCRVPCFGIAIGDTEVAYALDEVVPSKKEITALAFIAISRLKHMITESRRLKASWEEIVSAFVNTIIRIIFGQKNPNPHMIAIGQCLDELESYGISRQEALRLCEKAILGELNAVLSLGE